MTLPSKSDVQYSLSHRPPRQESKTFKAFMQCLDIAKAGKTFLFVHPNFVAIDAKTWRELQARLNPPVIYYDEASSITDKQLKEFDKAYKKYKKS